MAHCPVYGGHICSLCCSLDVRCEDKCRPKATIMSRCTFLHPFLPDELLHKLSSPISQFMIVLTIVSSFYGRHFRDRLQPNPFAGN